LRGLRGLRAPRAPQAPQAPQAAAMPRTPALEESGPMFLDEDPRAPRAERGPETVTGLQPQPQQPQPQPLADRAPERVWAADGMTVRAAATASAPTESAVPGQQPAAVPWAQQVHDLARQVPPQGGEAAAPTPWRPVADDPFAAAREQARPASLGKRLAARLIDTVVAGAVVAAAAVPLGTTAYQHLRDKVDAARMTGEEVTVWLIDGTTGLHLGIVAAVALVTGLLYEVLPTAKWGRTLGKKLLGLRVLDIEGQYEPGFGQALRRWLTRTVLDALVIGFLGLVWCLFDRPWRQCWHDKAARTFVARER
ncbi:RDD family protein, partial [Streptomyces sp. ME01-24h]|nr:RDD family protein [Streptomyces sp. ME01-24h]